MQSIERDYDESAFRNETTSKISLRLNFHSIGKSKTNFTASKNIN